MNSATMNAFKRLTFILLSYLFVVSCVNIDDLSDDNSISSFTLISHAPQTIELASAEIRHDTIYIPVKFGKYEFPMKFYAKLDIAQDIDKVMGIDLTQEQCLNSIDDKITFYVMAKSGLTRTYVIKAYEIPLDENNNISEAVKIHSIQPNDTYCSSRGMASPRGDTLTLFTVGGADKYPMVITPEFIIPAEASFEDFENGVTPLEFKNAVSTHVIKVVSKSGAKKYWRIRLKSTPIEDENTSLSQSQLLTTNISPSTFKTTVPENTYSESVIDNTRSHITIRAKSTTGNNKLTFPFNVTINFEVKNGVELFGIENPANLSFANLDETKEFFLLDPLKGISRKWVVNLGQIVTSDANILSFTFEPIVADVPTDYLWEQSGFKWAYRITEYKKCITLDTDGVEIYPETGEIIIPTSNLNIEVVVPNKNFTKGHNYKADRIWNLKLNNIQVGLPTGATSTAPTKCEWASNYQADILGGDGGGIGGLGGAVQNTTWKTTIPFSVTAQDGTTTKEWKIILRDPMETFVPSTACDLTDFAVSKILPTYAHLDPSSPPIIDAETKTITIKILDDENCYPISIYPSCSYSAYAKITSQNGGTEPMIFNSKEDINTLTIVAQDGITSSNWKVKILPPSKSTGADVQSFDVTGITEGYNYADPIITAQTGTITIPLNSTGKLPLVVSYDMVFSDKATSTTKERGTFTYNSIVDKASFEVLAQDGSSKLWIVKLDYRPQLYNGDFNKWITDKDNLPQPAAPWSTANNTSTPEVSRSTSVDLGGGNLAASLKSGAILGKYASGSIFLGRFEFNMARGLTDPISLTYFGLPFQATAKIIRVEAEIAYTGGSKNYGMPTPFDYGSVVVEFVDYKDKTSDPAYSRYQYHGLYPGGEAPRSAGYGNNASQVAEGSTFFANQSGTSHKGKPIQKVAPGAWTKIEVPINYPNPMVVPAYTHLHIVFSTSALGADFKGYEVSHLMVDNVKLIYEE